MMKDKAKYFHYNIKRQDEWYSQLVNLEINYVHKDWYEEEPLDFDLYNDLRYYLIKEYPTYYNRLMRLPIKKVK